MGVTYAVAAATVVATQTVHSDWHLPVPWHAVPPSLGAARVEVDHVVGIRSATDSGVAAHRTLNVLPATRRTLNVLPVSHRTLNVLPATQATSLNPQCNSSTQCNVLSNPLISQTVDLTYFMLG